MRLAWCWVFLGACSWFTSSPSPRAVVEERVEASDAAPNKIKARRHSFPEGCDFALGKRMISEDLNGDGKVEPVTRLRDTCIGDACEFRVFAPCEGSGFREIGRVYDVVAVELGEASSEDGWRSLVAVDDEGQRSELAFVEGRYRAK